jgi:ATP-dependent DNA ligase
MLYSNVDGVRLISRNGNTFKSFPGLCEGLARDLKGRRCVLDGEIVSLTPVTPDAKPRFRNLSSCRAVLLCVRRFVGRALTVAL